MVEKKSQKLFARLCLTVFRSLGWWYLYFEPQKYKKSVEYLLTFCQKNKQRHLPFRIFLEVNEETCGKIHCRQDHLSILIIHELIIALITKRNLQN